MVNGLGLLRVFNVVGCLCLYLLYLVFAVSFYIRKWTETVVWVDDIIFLQQVYSSQYIYFFFVLFLLLLIVQSVQDIHARK